MTVVKPARKPNPRQGYRLTAIVALLAKPMTASEIAQALGCERCAVLKYLRVLKQQDGVIHRCGWRENKRGGPAPVYIAGPGVDVPARERLSDSQRQARFRSKNPGYKKKYRSTRALSVKSEKKVPVPFMIPDRDPLTAAFFGGGSL